VRARIVPVLKSLNDRYGIVHGHIETCHSYTNDQNLIDNYHKASRRGRSAALNMVITETGAAKAVAKVIPDLVGKLTGNAIRVPTPNVSLVILNLELGQRLVKSLLEDDAIRGNLLFMAVSYNSGQGTLARWLQSIHHGGDALLFMESIPARETRAFVARVMTNYWAYSNRLGLSSPSLDAIAAGDWPRYDAAQSNAMAVKYVKNR